MKNEKRTRAQRIIHFATIIGILALAIPAGFNKAFIPLILALMGVNLFNGARRFSKGKVLVMLGIVSALPVIVYVTLVGVR
ncbi:hypothetical protein QWT69_16245 [Sporosarcina oncorhynchi]|uniref:Uncharacterized protein n=1 Tax=Sporosarcina oncorhynchi TaxID=3056444 RepID=A0ABZ0L5J6_9BACL|nr:hypothetical protein [Sporosarcina sp. T2O-4]WOV87378.1 hypothetical protein QWT69_16245 [Sporosarcina sp. T2O-4]